MTMFICGHKNIILCKNFTIFKTQVHANVEWFLPTTSFGLICVSVQPAPPVVHVTKQFRWKNMSAVRGRHIDLRARLSLSNNIVDVVQIPFLLKYST